MLAANSRFLKSIFLARHSFEFGILSWEESIAQLTGRRASDGETTILLPEFQKKIVKKILALIYTGELWVDNEQDAADVRSLSFTLRIDSFKIKDLQVISVGPDGIEKKVAIGNKNNKVNNNKKKTENNKTPTKSSNVKKQLSNEIQSSPTIKTHECEVCETKFTFHGRTLLQNLQRYVSHMVSHFKDSVLGDIPEMDKYFCPHEGCSLTTHRRYIFLTHLASTHSEFYPRVVKRLKNSSAFLTPEERTQLLAVRKFLVSSPLLDFDPESCPKVYSEEISICHAFEQNAMTSSTDYNCLQCDESFKNSNNAVLHLFTDHSDQLEPFGMPGAWEQLNNPEVGKLKCPEAGCDFSSWSKTGFVGHIGHVHAFFATIDLPSFVENVNANEVFVEYKTKYAEPKRPGRPPASASQSSRPSTASKKDDTTCVIEFSHNSYDGLFFECKNCDLALLPHDSMQSHLERKHDMPITLKCGMCGERSRKLSFPSAEVLSVHSCLAESNATSTSRKRSVASASNFELLGNAYNYDETTGEIPETETVYLNANSISGEAEDENPASKRLRMDNVNAGESSSSYYDNIISKNQEFLNAPDLDDVDVMPPDEPGVQPQASTSSNTIAEEEVIELDSD